MSKENQEFWRLPEPSFDVNSISIDYEETDEFYITRVGEERGSNLMLRGQDRHGNQVLLKGSTFFRDAYRLMSMAEFRKKQLSETGPLSSEAILTKQKENVHLAALAYRFGQIMGFQMIEAYETEIDGFPFLAMKYLPDAKDRGYGTETIQYPEPAVQTAQLASGALLKFMFDALEDDGQYLQTTDGTLYMSDIRLLPIGTATANLHDAIARVLTQVGDREASDGTQLFASSGIFSNQADVLLNQLAGSSSLHFATILHKLENLSYQDVITLLSDTPAQPSATDEQTARHLLDRAHLARPVFELLRNNAETTAKALKTRRQQQPICSDYESYAAQETLLELAQR